MFPLNDALDVVLLGTFLFGLLFTIGTLLLGAADVGHHIDADHGGDTGHELLGMLNVTSILAFVTWFGGVGYMVRNGIGTGWVIALVLAVVGGVAAAALVTYVIRNVLSKADDTLDPRDYERVGVLARVTASIRGDGVGEIVWEQRGSRMVTSARSVDQQPIPRGTEVLILRVERGVAIVEPFDALLE